MIDGRPVKGRPLPAHPREQLLRDQGFAAPELYELDPSAAGVFRDRMLGVKQKPEGAAVEVYPEEDYAGMRLFMDADGTTGYALRGDELVSVFSTPEAPKRVGRHLTASAVDQGARRGDAFDTVLPFLYAKEGLRVVARMPFNDEYAPDGWDYGFFQRWNGGRPDVVFMGYDPAQVDQPYMPGSGVVVDDYDEGLRLAKEQADRHRKR